MQNLFIDVVPLSREHCSTPIECHLAYATKENFLGRIVTGYHPEATQICLMAQNAARSLCEAQNQLNQMQLGLFVFDSYRPLRAVRDFKNWMQAPVLDNYELERKQIHYPHIEKSQLANLGYLAAEVSNHCFGDTVDLSLIDLRSKQLLNMGACFDYFDEISYPSATAAQIGQEAFNNRQLLSSVMQKVGFIPHNKEFWHFTFRDREILAPADFEILP